MTFRRLLVGAVVAVAAYFAVFGGEYNLFEMNRLEQRAAEEQRRIDSLAIQVDSLQRRAEALTSDSAAIERLARERYGMIRDGERLYRFAEPDSTESGAGSGAENTPESGAPQR